MTPRWFYSLDGKTKIGPVELDELRRLAGRGELKPSHMLLAENTGKWQPASALAELFGVTTAPRPAPGPNQRLRHRRNRRGARGVMSPLPV